MTTITIEQDIPGLKDTEFADRDQLFDALCQLYFPDEDCLSGKDLSDFQAAKAERAGKNSTFRPVLSNE